MVDGLDFETLARLSYWTLSVAREAEQRAILDQLNAIAAEFLHMGRGQSQKTRREYLTVLSLLIRKHLALDYVSMFYRNQVGDRLACFVSGWAAEDFPVGLTLTSRYGTIRWTCGNGLKT